mmetsp:Transcript_36726/g.78250  ORF Transcript_36726/g.78250 Transcript_36726/m.78250 type:complete len:474 (-) Transcript_36726:484-1905(-)
MKDVQGYNQEGWYYKTELHKFVNSGMRDMSFIDSISGIVNRGCHNPPCATGEVDGLVDRRSNFQKVLMVFGLPSLGSRPPSTLPPIPAPAIPAPAASLTIDAADPKLINAFLHRLNSHRSSLERNVLSYQARDGTTIQSDVYTFDSLIESVAYACQIGHAGKLFYIGSPGAETLGDDQPMTNLRYGLVNIAAFLAQSQNEGIVGNACDEYHLDAIDGKYPVSNSCGQFGDNYQGLICSRAERAMECPVEENMKVAAAPNGKHENSLYDYRPGFYCGPDENFTGAYDPNTRLVEMGPFANSAGRNDVKGCCFWGRGAMLTKGPCMLGKLNHYLGAEAAKNGKMAKFPDVDFCRSPGDICKNIERHPTIVWDIALFEWVERVQPYEDGNFNYQLALQKFVDGGMKDPTFINSVSNIVATGPRFYGKRLSHFNLIMEHLQLKGRTPLVKSRSTSGQRIDCVPPWLFLAGATMSWAL